MAIKKSEKKKLKMDAKKLGRILSFALLTIALLVGIIFSSVKVHMNMIYGPEYNGAFQASVQVINKTDEAKKQSLNEDAKSLSDKLAPFSDKSITITKQGKNHLNVVVGKQDYENNETYLRNQIESNGGLFVLSGTQGDYSDWYIDGDSRSASTDFFKGKVKTKTLSNGSGRDPFVQIGLNGTAFADKLNKEKTQSPLMFITDLEEMIDTLRFLYVVNDKESTIETYYDSVIAPMAKRYKDAKDSNKDDKTAKVLSNLFAGTVTFYEPGSTLPVVRRISLLENTFSNVSGGVVTGSDQKERITGINSVNDLKAILPYFTPNTSDMPTSNFIYGPDSSLDKNYKFTDWLHNDKNAVDGLDSQTVFKTTVNNFLNDDILYKQPAHYKKSKYKFEQLINPDLLKIAPQLGNNILYNGLVVPSTEKAGVSTSISGEVATDQSFIVDNAKHLKQDGSGVVNAFYLRTKNLTSAKKAVASIKQNALGLAYLVESIVNVNPYITSVLYITSLVFLSIVAVLLAAYVLYVYRLLGLFTLIIAVCAVAITLLGAAGFGIAMGPQVICALFLIIALIMDTNFVLFEGWKHNYYEEKHGIISSFKIGSKATLSMAVDAILVAFIPNIILFWAATGPLKTFGTLSIIGVGLAVVVGVIIGRFIYWLLLKNKWVQKTDWLLPIDTRYSSLATIKDEFAINKYTNFLENHEGQTKYTTKELTLINDAKIKLEEAQKSYNKNLLISNEKTAKRDLRTIASIKKNTARLENLRAWLIKTFKISKPAKNPMIRMIDGKLEDNSYILGITDEVDNSETPNKAKLRDKGRIVRADRAVGRGMTFLSLALLVIGVIAAIVGGVTSVRWANGVGYGQQFVIYGDELKQISSNIGSTRFALTDESIAKEWKSITEKYSDENNSGNQSKDSSSVDYTAVQSAYELRDFFKYIADEKKFSDLGFKSYTKHISLTSPKFDVLINYQHVKPDTQEAADNSMVALQIGSTSTNKHSRSEFKRLLVAMATGQWPNSNTDPKNYTSATGGIEAYDMAPYTVNNQIKNVGVAFGIALAVLVAYILIRFKWTYYVALALGLGLVIGVVVSLIVIFRIPMSTEMLCGMVFVITFALTSMILVLGRGKSKLNLTDKENVRKNFSGSIKLAADIRAKKAETSKVYLPKRKELRKLRWKIIKLQLKRFVHRGTGVDVQEIHDLIDKYGKTKYEYIKIRKEQTGIYKEFKDKTKQKQNELQRKNWYFKALFASLIRYSAWRMATLGVFYLLVGIILSATLSTIFGMGVTIVLGIIASMAVALFIAVPIWVYFEKRRIRYAYGRKVYIESLKVSHEEEIVKGIND